MSALQRLTSGLAHRLRLSGRQLEASQQAAAFHWSASVEARRRQAAPASSDSESDTEAASGKPGAVWQDQEQRGGKAGEAGALYEAVQANAAAFDVQTLISPALAAMLEAVPDNKEEADKVYEEFAAAADKLERTGGKASSPEELASDDDLRLLAEAIDIYFKAAPETDPEIDELEDEDRQMLAVLGSTITEVLDGGARTKTINTAPPGRLPWEILDVNEDVPMVNWGVDLTEGRAEDGWKNALLSEAAKQTMWQMHKDGWDVPSLAEHFKIRQQRVMAILVLKDKEQEAREAGLPVHTDLAEAMEHQFGAYESMGSGERHHVVLPSYPNYRELTEDDAERLAALLEQRLGKPFADIEQADLTPELAQELLAAAGMDKRALEEELAQREEAHLVAEFKRALEYNTGKTGTSLSRSSRKKHPPKRPEGGWGLLVKPLGKAARSGERTPFVALPDGTQRQLTADEQLQLERQQPRPRHKIA